MRLEVTLEPVHESIELPINMNGAVRGLIEAVLDERFTYCRRPVEIRDIRELKREYTFSQLHIPERRIMGRRIRARRCPITLYVSSPDIRIISCIMHGFMERGAVVLGGEKMRVVKAESREEACRGEHLRVSCLSPFVVERPGISKKHLQFALPNEYDLAKYLSRTMTHRYEAYYGGSSGGHGELAVYFDPHYVLKRKGKITKLITVAFEGSRYPMKIKGIQSPMILEGDAKLLQFSLEAGLGSYTDYGFGMLHAYRD